MQTQFATENIEIISPDDDLKSQKNLSPSQSQIELGIEEKKRLSRAAIKYSKNLQVWDKTI